MPNFPTGTRSPFARAVSAEVRARMAAERVPLRDFASRVGFRSHNYLAIRLRDEKPFTLDDVDLICEFFQEDAPAFLQAAYDHHEERLWAQAMDAEKAARAHANQVADYVVQSADGAAELIIEAKDYSKAGDDEVARAVARLDEHTRATRPSRQRAMQQLEDQAARDEDSRA